jgi:hypothetical protein
VTRPPTSPVAAPADAPAARPRCPRCGATLGRLDAEQPAAGDALYCGCCGLVLPAPAASSGDGA